MLKSTLMSAVSILLLYPSVGFSQKATTSPAVSTPTITDVITCAELDGSLTHRLSQIDTGEYSAYITFPVHYKKQSPAELEASKKLWREWDGKGPTPPDTRKIGVSLPMDSGNIYNFDIPRLTEKANYFDSLFPPVDNTSHIPVGFGSFVIKFAQNECSVVEAEGHMSVHCENFDKVLINNIEVTQRVLQMSTEIATEVIFDYDAQKAVIIKTPKVKTSLILKTQHGSRIQNFRSSYTYTPNGNEKQCHVKGEKLSAK